MEARIIEKINNNTRAITLMKEREHVYSVTEKNGTHYKTQVFCNLILALEYFNHLSEVFNESR